MTTNAPTTFKVDNVLIERVPKLFAARNVQMHLPGLEPFGPFDLWAALAVYSLADPADPNALIHTTPTELLEVLEFAKTVSNSVTGYDTYRTDQYRLLEEALQRLYSVDVKIRAYWKVYIVDQKTGKRGRGRPKKQWVEYRGRILQSYSFTYPPGVTPPELQANEDRENVNRAKNERGDKGPPIWKLKEGGKPQGITLRLGTDFVKGIAKEDPHIGSTVFPVRVFSLRKTLGKSPKAVYLLTWISRQPAKTMTRRLDWLADYLEIRGRNTSRNRETVANYFALLKQEGVLTSFEIYDKNGIPWVRWTKAPEWHFEQVAAFDFEVEDIVATAPRLKD